MNSDGNRILGTTVKKIIDEHVSAAFCVSGRGTTGEYFWRGFLSPVGSSRPKNTSSLHPGRGIGGGVNGEPVSVVERGRGGPAQWAPPPR